MAKKTSKPKQKVTKLKPEEPQQSGFMKALVWIVVNVITLYIVAYLLPGFELANFTSALVAAIVIGAINAFIRPILEIIALPLSIMTLGIFAFLINVFLLMAASWIVPGFEISDFWTAVLASILLSLIGWFFRHISKV